MCAVIPFVSLAVKRLLALVLILLPTAARATDYIWSNPAGGAYGTGSNWSGGVVPTGTDNATIDLGGTYTVTLTSANAINNLTLNSANLSFSHTAGTYTVNGGITLTAGTYNLNGGTISGGVLTTGGGSGVLAAGTSTFSTLNNVQIGVGALNLSTAAGFLNFTGGTSFTAPSTYTTGATFVLRVNQAAAINNLDLTLGINADFQVNGAAGLTIGASTIVRYVGASGAIGTVTGSASGVGPITNQGLIERTGTAGTFRVGTNVILTNSGTIRNAGTATAARLEIGDETRAFTNQAGGRIEALGGTTVVAGLNWTNAGVLQLANGAVLQLDGTFNTNNLGTIDRGGAPGSNGTLDLAGTMTLGAALNLQTTTGPLRMNGGSISGGGLTLSSSGAARLVPVSTAAGINTLDNAQLAAGVLDLSAANARLRLQGGTNFAPGSTYTLGDSYLLEVNQAAAINNLDLTLGASGQVLSGALGLTIGTSSVIRTGSGINAISGSSGTPVTNQGLIVDASSALLNLGQGGPVSNSGTIRQSSTVGPLTIGLVNQGHTFTNQAGGRVEALAGVTIINATNWTNAGTFQLAAGATLQLDGTFNSTNLGTIDRGGAPGSNGTLNLLGVMTLGANLDLNTTTGNLIAIAGNGSQIIGAGNTLSSSGAARFTPAGTTFDNVQIAPTAMANLNTLTILGGTNFTAPTVLTGSGINVNQTQAINNLDLTLPANGTIAASGALGLTLGPTTTVRYTSATGTGVVGNGAAGQPVTNQGLIVNSAAGTLRISPNGTFTNTGTVRASAGLVRFQNVTTTLTVGATGILDAPGGTVEVQDAVSFTNFSAGTLTGGTYRASGGGTLDFGTRQITTLGTGTTVTLTGPSTFAPLNSLATVGSGAALNLLAGQNLNLPGSFVNNGGIIIEGGTVAVPTSVTNNGSIIIEGGTVAAPSGFINNGSLTATGTINAPTQFNAGTTLSVPGTLTIGGTVAVNAPTTLSGGILNTTGAVAIPSSFTIGSGARLNAAENVAVNPGGRLIVAGGGRANVAATRAIIVEGGLGNPGVLQGSGIVGGKVVVQQHGRVRPGESPGVITIENGLDLDGTYEWELNGNTIGQPGQDFDQVVVSVGNLRIQPNATMALRLTNVDFNNAFWSQNREWTIAVLQNGQIENTFATPPFVESGPDPSAHGFFGFAYLPLNPGAELHLTWTAAPVPEPSFILGLATLALVGVMLGRRFARARCVRPLNSTTRCEHDHQEIGRIASAGV